MTDHTKGHWRAEGFAIYDEHGRMILQIGVSADRSFSESEMEANARRIVACVNACVNIPTDALEKGRLSPDAFRLEESRADKAEQQRDDLLAAARATVEAFDKLPSTSETRMVPLHITGLRNAIAITKGDA